MERYKIQESILDVIRILDSAPLRPDMVAETNLVQLTNRAPISHLAIERGLKALIADAGGTEESIHALNKLYEHLSHCDRKSADFLAAAFDDAVRFFGFDVTEKGLRHLVSLDTYLSKVGTKGVFDALRYWAIGVPGEAEHLIGFLSPPMHRELLYSLWCLFADRNSTETVTDRVERIVAHAMYDRRDSIWSSEDTVKENSICRYRNWLFEKHPSCRSALKEAVERDFIIQDDAFLSQILREAYSELRQSEDPAVLYFVGNLTYLPKGSQPRIPGAVPQVEWLGGDRRMAVVNTPGGTPLGHIRVHADGAWSITPMEEGSVRVAAATQSLEDAQYYLVNRRTIEIAVEDGGPVKHLRVVKKMVYTQDSSMTYQFDFWDPNHGLTPGDDISIRVPVAGSHGLEQVINGKVTEVSQQTVSIAGVSFDDIGRSP